MRAMQELTGPGAPEAVAVNLIAVLVAVREDQPRVLTIGGGAALPSGPFELAHRSLQSGLRDWVEQQTHRPIGYVEQLYTFADRDRLGETNQRMVSISYLGLTREEAAATATPSSWRDWYAFFPWEDRRTERPPHDEALRAALARWAEAAKAPALRLARTQRIAVSFGLEPFGWNEELVLQRYELLFEAGLIPEARDAEAARDVEAGLCAKTGLGAGDGLGARMTGDHRRILATGIARLRAKIKYRPVVFELMAPTFTLYRLQRSVEALAGRRLHKQNFRRLIEQQDLVEETGALATDTGGRPAKLYGFRRDVLAARAVAGSKLPLAGA